MDRRRFLLTSLAGVLAAPLAAEGQQKKNPIVGFLGAACPVGTGPDAAFLRGLQDLGYIVGDNIVIECRVSEGTIARYRELVTELTRLHVDLIVAVSSGAVRAVPTLAHVTVLSDVAMDPKPLKAIEAVGRSLGVRVHVVHVRGAQGIDAAVRAATMAGIGGALLLIPSPIMDNATARDQIAALALTNRVPTVAPFPSFVKAGSLISYGPDLGASFGELSLFIDRILKGTPPGDLPIQRPSRFHLAINLKTAKVLGLTIPPSLLARADQVIE